MTSAATPLRARPLDAGLPPRPTPELDPYLDAAERCVARYGWSRTSPKDIAAEAGVERTTIYRYLGAKEQIWRLIVAREVHRIIDAAMTFVVPAAPGPEVVVDVVCMAVQRVLDNPVTVKVRSDDPELVGSFVHTEFSDVIERFTHTLSPVVAVAMKAGYLAPRDPVALTQWVLRVAITLVLAPHPGPLRPFLASMLLPVLEPAGRATPAPTKAQRAKPKPRRSPP